MLSELVTYLGKSLFASQNRKSALVWTAAFLLCFAMILIHVNTSHNYGASLSDFEAGKVADRDVFAEQSITYEDEYATSLRRETQERLVPAVYHYSNRTTEELRNQWKRFAAMAEIHTGESRTLSAYSRELQMEFPGEFSDDVLVLLYESQMRQTILEDCADILEMILGKGIYSVPHSGLEKRNPDVAELIRQVNSRIELERVPLVNIVTREGIASAVETAIASGSYNAAFAAIAPSILGAFLKENVFYSPEDTERRIIEARVKVEPVMRNIEQGKNIIRKGFVVSEEEMAELNILQMTLSNRDLPQILAYLLFLLMVFALLCYFSGSRVMGRKLNDRETYLVSGLSALYIGGSVLVRSIPLDSMPVSVLVPTALIMMLPAILINTRLALMMSMALPLGAFMTGSFDTSSFIFAIVSGLVASCSLQGAEKRMDLIRAGLIIAGANIIAMIAILLWQHSSIAVYPSCLFWGAFNGIASGMLVMGCLPLLEHALNAATSFRLIELSDLNTPTLKRLFTTAPGTYSHSIMVANLSEAACQDIGANSLLARVGSYYHDLGKMDNPGYFVENQTESNPHDDLAPRLSATIIRSHVKLGVEKARNLGLPREVIDIIEEHHGNSVITWFYSKALKTEDTKKAAVNMEDFCYPGNPPRSKESAVVMLADMTEAAARTISKPTALKIEKQIQELITKRVEDGQLARSELSFRDLETIKNAFVRGLAAYYHSRIEYPKIENGTESKDAAAGTVKEAAE